MNIHLLDLFTIQFSAGVANKVRNAIDIGMTDQEVSSYCVKSASKLINELPKFYLEEKNQSLLNDLVTHSPPVTSPNIFEDVNLKTSKVLRNGKFLVHGIYGTQHTDFLKMIDRSFKLTAEQANYLWYISGGVILMLIHSLTNNENDLTDLISIVSREAEATKSKTTFSLSGLLRFQLS